MTPGAEDEYDDDDDDDDHDDDDNEDAAHDDVDEFVDATQGATDDEDDDNDDDDDDADDDGAPQRRELRACTIEDLQEAPRARREIALRRELLADAPEEPNAAREAHARMVAHAAMLDQQQRDASYTQTVIESQGMHAHSVAVSPTLSPTARQPAAGWRSDWHH